MPRLRWFRHATGTGNPFGGWETFRLLQHGVELGSFVPMPHLIAVVEVVLTAFASKMCAERGFQDVVEDAGVGGRALVGRGRGAAFPGHVRPGPRMEGGGGSEAGLSRDLGRCPSSVELPVVLRNPGRGGGVGGQGAVKDIGGSVSGRASENNDARPGAGRRKLWGGSRVSAQDGALEAGREPAGLLRRPRGLRPVPSLPCTPCPDVGLGAARRGTSGSACPSPTCRFSWQSGVNALQLPKRRRRDASA